MNLSNDLSAAAISLQTSQSYEVLSVRFATKCGRIIAIRQHPVRGAGLTDNRFRTYDPRSFGKAVFDLLGALL
jgi:hypothetical protein